MRPITSTGVRRPALPTLADIQRRRAELLGSQPSQQAKQQSPLAPKQPHPAQPHPAAPAPPQPPDSGHPTCPGVPWGLPPAALHGLAGTVVRTIVPHTEAHPAAILLQLLAAFGNLVGRGPHCMVDATRHGLNLFVVLVGDSSKARKGTSWSQIARLFAEVDHPWLSTCVTRARLTASGLVYALRDQQPPTDRRLLALSEEFASILYMLKRAKGHLSPLLRNAWDSGDLLNLDMQQHLQA